MFKVIQLARGGGQQPHLLGHLSLPAPLFRLQVENPAPYFCWRTSAGGRRAEQEARKGG